MDALSDVLRVVGLTGGVFVEAEFSDPWLVEDRVDPDFCKPFMPIPESVMCFHYVVEGAFDLRLQCGEGARLTAGEIVLMPHNDIHIFGSAPHIAPVPAGSLITTGETGGIQKIEHGGGGSVTRLVCGFLGGGAELALLLSSLPRMMVIRVADAPGGDWIAHSFRYAAHNLGRGDPGSATVMAKMCELLFVETVRQHLARLPADQKGWLAGLRDPAVSKALALMHARIAENWSTDALASAVAMSRSAFAERFTNLIGSPPMRYLTAWRMQVAAGRLRRTRDAVAQVAFDVGYESEAAFTRAFRREMGAPPAAWRKRAGSE